MMSNDVSIVIPTHNRHKYLERILDYYSSENLMIYIADSTGCKYAGELPKNCHYFHCPAMPYMNKMAYIFSLVSTDLCVMCADDDFISPQAIRESADFLKENKDFSSVQGNYVGFYWGNDAEIVSYPCDLGKIQDHFDVNSLNTRMLKGYKNYSQLYYSVHRTEISRRFFEEISGNPEIENGFIIEIAHFFCLLSTGKNKHLPIFYSAREIIPTSTGATIANVSALSRSKKGKREIEALESFCNSYLQKTHSKNPDLDPKLAGLAIEEALEFFRENNPFIRGFVKPLLVGLRPYIPSFVLKMKRIALRQMTTLELHAQLLASVADLRGFPYSSKDIRSKKEFEHMKSLIYKHQC